MTANARKGGGRCGEDGAFSVMPVARAHFGIIVLIETLALDRVLRLGCCVIDGSTLGHNRTG